MTTWTADGGTAWTVGCCRPSTSAARIHAWRPSHALSWSGEHGVLWLAAGLTGAVVDRGRRGAWLRGTALTATAHLASMGVKQIVRRPRPRTSSRWCARPDVTRSPAPTRPPATAAAVAFGALGVRPLPPLAAAMCLSRLVAASTTLGRARGRRLGALTARLGARWIEAGHG